MGAKRARREVVRRLRRIVDSVIGMVLYGVGSMLRS